MEQNGLSERFPGAILTIATEPMSENPRFQRATSASNIRKYLRSDVRIPAQLAIPGTRRFNATIIDLSASGFRAQTANRLPINGTVYLSIPGLESRQATVLWNLREFYGCEFTQPLHESICAHLSQKFPDFF
jgi:PilZ domain